VPLFADGNPPLEVTFQSVRASLFLFDGGMAILAIEPTYALRDPDRSAARFPELVKATADQSVRYENQAVTNFCKSLLNTFASRLHAAVTAGGAPDQVEIALPYKSFVGRPTIRSISVPEIYPTIVTKIHCNASLRPSRYDLRRSDLATAMYLDETELTNALPTFEDDLIAVGYDSVWWLLAANPQERPDRFRDRVELTLQYALAVSMLIYVLHAEIDQELAAIRTLTSRDQSPDRQALAVKIRSLRRLRGEVEDLLKEISLESFSTWVSDIHLFRCILDHWLVDASVRALRQKIEAVNVILREIHQDNTEREQSDLTQLGTIFAAASLAGLFVAAVTLLFTETHWEAQDSAVAWRLLVVKVLIATYLVALPATLLWFIRFWIPRIVRALEKIPPSTE